MSDIVITAGGGQDDGTTGSGAISDVNNSGGYDISTGGTNTGGGLAEILTNNSNALVDALKQNSNAQISQGKTLIDAITSGALLKRVAMKKISDEMSKHGLNSKDYMDKKAEHLDHAKNGNPNLKNSVGETIIPRDANALHNSEKAIETANMNKTDFGKVTKNIIDELEDDEEIDINIMVTAIDDMFNLDGIDFDNLPNNLKEGV